MEILLCCLYALVFIWVIMKWSFFGCKGISRKALAAIFVIKIGFGLFLWCIYTYYYTDRSEADIYKYFDDSKVMVNALFTNPGDFFKMLFGIGTDGDYFRENYFDIMNHWYREHESNLFNDNRTIIRLNVLLHLFSFGYYNVHTIFMCFISMLGLTALYKTFASRFIGMYRALAIVIFLVPSVLLWGSGVLKEGLLLFGLGMVFFYFFRLVEGNFRIKHLPVLIVAIFLLLVLKFYILIALVPGMLAWWWVSKTEKLAAVKHAVCLVAITAIGLNFHYISPSHDALEILVKKQKWFIGLVKHEESGSRFDMKVLDPTIASFSAAIPLALNNSFLRPYIWQGGGMLNLAAALENMGVLLLIIGCIIFSKPIKQIDFNLFFFLNGFVLILYVLIGWITPVVGAIVRYKVPAIPLLLIAFLIILDTNKLPWKRSHSSQALLQE